MSYEDVGQALKAAREQRHLSIEDIADKLKISARQLRAIESGDIDQLPHLSYAKGFIRSYATAMGLNPEEIQALINRPAGATENPENDNSMLEMAEKPVRSAKGLVFFIAVCILGAILYYIWQAGMLDFLWEQKEDYTQSSEKLPDAEAYMAGRDAARANAPVASAQQVSEQPRPTAPQPKAPEKAPTPPSPAEPAAAIKTEPAEPATGPVVAGIPEPAATSPQSLPGHHKLIITAIEECWVHSNADQTDTRQFSLRKGDTFALTFTNSLELKLGNAGGVRLRYDGEDLPAAGTPGQVKTMTFPPAAS